jgi:outer membrane protein OmpA-like peptidoglycan-associated protein
MMTADGEVGPMRMLTNNSRAWVLLLVIAALARPAAAVPPPMDAQNFQPHTDYHGWFSTHYARTLELGKPAFAMWITYARDPVLYRHDDGSFSRVVGDLATMDLQAAIGLGPADLAVDIPVHLAISGEGFEGWSDAFVGTAVGDIRIVPKVRFLDAEEKGFGVGLVLPLSVPTGNEELYVGRSFLSFSPMLILSGHIGMLRLGANLGYRITRPEEVEDLIAGNAFLWRAAVSVTPIDALAITGEVIGDVRGVPRNDPTEWLAGATIHPVPGVAFRVAAGTSIGQGVPSPEGRIVFGLGYTVVPPADSDGDGVADRADECPDQPEDIDGWEDDDGCPDPDNDGDGILDGEDECPDRPEDLNGVDDKDGCPDEIGDRDGDGFPDDEDDCPTQPETVNGVEDDDGCPDTALVELVVEDAVAEIRIFEKVYFDLAKATIKPTSYPVLNAVDEILVAYPNIRKVEIQGHTDTRGDDGYNLELSQNRANAVRTYLIDRGIAPDRLVAAGYGEQQLIDPATTEEAHAANRRVQFIVLVMD